MTELAEIVEKINDTELAENTKKKYTNTIKRLYDKIDIFNIEEVITFIDTYTNLSTIISYISIFLKVYELCGYDTEYELLHQLFILKRTEKDQSGKGAEETEATEKKPKKDIKEAYKIIDNLKIKRDELINRLNHSWDNNRQYLALAVFILEHGAIRGDELVEMWISKDDTDKYENYININKKIMVINKHKNMKKDGQRVIKLSNNFIDLIKDYHNRYFITNDSNITYKDATGLNKKVKKILGYSIYDFRYALSSVNLEKVNKNLAYNQGHSLATQQKIYTKFI